MELATPAVNAPTKEALQVETVLPGKEIETKHLSILDKHLYNSQARNKFEPRTLGNNKKTQDFTDFTIFFFKNFGNLVFSQSLQCVWFKSSVHCLSSTSQITSLKTSSQIIGSFEIRTKAAGLIT